MTTWHRIDDPDHPAPKEEPAKAWLNWFMVVWDGGVLRFNPCRATIAGAPNL